MSTENEVVEAVTEVATEAVKTSVSANADLLGMFAQLLSQQGDAADARMLAFAETMKKGSPEEEKKREEARERDLLRTRIKIETAKRQEAAREQGQSRCSHLRPNRTANLKGTMLSNGYAAVTCGECGYSFPPFKGTDAERMAGLDIESWGSNAPAIVLARAASSPPPPPLMEIPYGARLEFVGE